MLKAFKTLRVISWMLIIAFSAEHVSYAAYELKPELFAKESQKVKLAFDFPVSIAKVEDNWAVKNQRTKNSKTVYLIQDAHTNESCQINIDKILNEVIAKENVRYVFTEAGFGDESLNFLRDQTPLDKRQIVAKSFLTQAKIDGLEYHNLTSDQNFVLWGVEDEDLYWQSVEVYRSIVDERDNFKSYLDQVEMTIQTLKNRIYNPALLILDSKNMEHVKGKLSLADYFQFLGEQAAMYKVDVKPFSHLRKLSELQAMEKGIDFSKANIEQVKAVTSLSAEDAAYLKEMTSGKSQAALKYSDKNDASQKEAFFAFLKDKTNQMQSYPQLAKYCDYLEMVENMDATKTLEELGALERQIYEAVYQNEDEKSLKKSEEALQYLQSLFSLKLTPDQFDAYRQDKSSYDIVKLTGFLNEKIKNLRTDYERVVFLENHYEDYVKKAEKFYELTYQRDVEFIRQLEAKMDAEKQSKSILVTGGYHCPNLKALFRSKNISYVVIQPQVLAETNQKRYEKMLLGQLDSTGKQITSDSVIPAKAGIVPNIQAKNIDVTAVGSRFADFKLLLQALGLELPAGFDPSRRRALQLGAAALVGATSLNESANAQAPKATPKTTPAAKEVSRVVEISNFTKGGAASFVQYTPGKVGSAKVISRAGGIAPFIPFFATPEELKDPKNVKPNPADYDGKQFLQLMAQILSSTEGASLRSAIKSAVMEAYKNSDKEADKKEHARLEKLSSAERNKELDKLIEKQSGLVFTTAGSSFQNRATEAIEVNSGVLDMYVPGNLSKEQVIVARLMMDSVERTHKGALKFSFVLPAGVTGIPGSPSLAENPKDKFQAHEDYARELVRQLGDHESLLYWKVGLVSDVHTQGAGNSSYGLVNLSIRDWADYVFRIGKAIRNQQQIQDEKEPEKKRHQRPILLGVGGPQIGLFQLFTEKKMREAFDALAITFYPGIKFTANGAQTDEDFSVLTALLDTIGKPESQWQITLQTGSYLPKDKLTHGQQWGRLAEILKKHPNAGNILLGGYGHGPLEDFLYRILKMEAPKGKNAKAAAAEKTRPKVLPAARKRELDLEAADFRDPLNVPDKEGLTTQGEQFFNQGKPDGSRMVTLPADILQTFKNEIKNNIGLKGYGQITGRQKKQLPSDEILSAILLSENPRDLIIRSFTGWQKTDQIVAAASRTKRIYASHSAFANLLDLYKTALEPILNDLAVKTAGEAQVRGSEVKALLIPALAKFGIEIPEADLLNDDELVHRQRLVQWVYYQITPKMAERGIYLARPITSKAAAMGAANKFPMVAKQIVSDDFVTTPDGNRARLLKVLDSNGELGAAQTLANKYIAQPVDIGKGNTYIPTVYKGDMLEQYFELHRVSWTLLTTQNRFGSDAYVTVKDLAEFLFVGPRTEKEVLSGYFAARMMTEEMSHFDLFTFGMPADAEGAVSVDLVNNMSTVLAKALKVDGTNRNPLEIFLTDGSADERSVRNLAVVEFEARLKTLSLDDIAFNPFPIYSLASFLLDDSNYSYSQAARFLAQYLAPKLGYQSDLNRFLVDFQQELRGIIQNPTNRQARIDELNAEIREASKSAYSSFFLSKEERRNIVDGSRLSFEQGSLELPGSFEEVGANRIDSLSFSEIKDPANVVIDLAVKGGKDLLDFLSEQQFEDPAVITVVSPDGSNDGDLRDLGFEALDIDGVMIARSLSVEMIKRISKEGKYIVIELKEDGLSVVPGFFKSKVIRLLNTDTSRNLSAHLHGTPQVNADTLNSINTYIQNGRLRFNLHAYQLTKSKSGIDLLGWNPANVLTHEEYEEKVKANEASRKKLEAELTKSRKVAIDAAAAADKARAKKAREDKVAANTEAKKSVDAAATPVAADLIGSGLLGPGSFGFVGGDGSINTMQVDPSSPLGVTLTQTPGRPAASATTDDESLYQDEPFYVSTQAMLTSFRANVVAGKDVPGIIKQQPGEIAGQKVFELFNTPTDANRLDYIKTFQPLSTDLLFRAWTELNGDRYVQQHFNGLDHRRFVVDTWIPRALALSKEDAKKRGVVWQAIKNRVRDRKAGEFEELAKVAGEIQSVYVYPLLTESDSSEGILVLMANNLLSLFPQQLMDVENGSARANDSLYGAFTTATIIRGVLLQLIDIHKATNSSAPYKNILQKFDDFYPRILPQRYFDIILELQPQEVKFAGTRMARSQRDLVVGTSRVAMQVSVRQAKDDFFVTVALVGTTKKILDEYKIITHSGETLDTTLQSIADAIESNPVLKTAPQEGFTKERLLSVIAGRKIPQDDIASDDLAAMFGEAGIEEIKPGDESKPWKGKPADGVRLAQSSSSEAVTFNRTQQANISFVPKALLQRLGLQVSSVETAVVQSSGETQSIFENSDWTAIYQASLLQALLSEPYIGGGKYIKEAADANASFATETVLKEFVAASAGTAQRQAVIVFGDEGAKDDSVSLGIGDIYYPDENGEIVHRKFDNIANVKKFVREHQTDFKFQFYAGDGIENTNGLADEDSKKKDSYGNSVSLAGFMNLDIQWFLSEEGYLSSDSLRVQVLASPFNIDGLGLTSFSTPEQLIDAVAVREHEISGGEIDLIKKRLGQEYAFFALRARTGGNVKTADAASASHRNDVNFASALKIFGSEGVRSDTDGNAVPAMLAAVGLLRFGKRLITIDRIGGPEAFLVTVFAANHGHKVLADIVSAEQTKAVLDPRTAQQLTDKEAEAVRPYGMLDANGKPKPVAQAAGPVAISVSTGLAPGVYGKELSGLLPRVQVDDNTGNIVIHTLLSVPGGTDVVIKTTLRSSSGNVDKLRNRLLKVRELPTYKQILQEAEQDLKTQGSYDRIKALLKEGERLKDGGSADEIRDWTSVFSSVTGQALKSIIKKIKNNSKNRDEFVKRITRGVVIYSPLRESSVIVNTSVDDVLIEDFFNGAGNPYPDVLDLFQIYKAMKALDSKPTDEVNRVKFRIMETDLAPLKSLDPVTYRSLTGDVVKARFNAQLVAALQNTRRLIAGKIADSIRLLGNDAALRSVDAELPITALTGSASSKVSLANFHPFNADARKLNLYQLSTLLVKLEADTKLAHATVMGARFASAIDQRDIRRLTGQANYQLKDYRRYGNDRNRRMALLHVGDLTERYDTILDTAALSVIARVYSEFGRFDEALQYAQRAIDIPSRNPDDMTLHARMTVKAGIYLKKGDYAQADIVLKQILARDAQDRVAAQEYAKSLILQRRSEEASSLLLSLLAFRQREDQIYFLLAVNDIAQNKYEDARKNLARSLAEKTNNKLVKGLSDLGRLDLGDDEIRDLLVNSKVPVAGVRLVNAQRLAETPVWNYVDLALAIESGKLVSQANSSDTSIRLFRIQLLNNQGNSIQSILIASRSFKGMQTVSYYRVAPGGVLSPEDYSKVIVIAGSEGESLAKGLNEKVIKTESMARLGDSQDLGKPINLAYMRYDLESIGINKNHIFGFPEHQLLSMHPDTWTRFLEFVRDTVQRENVNGLYIQPNISTLDLVYFLDGSDTSSGVTTEIVRYPDSGNVTLNFNKVAGSRAASALPAPTRGDLETWESQASTKNSLQDGSWVISRSFGAHYGSHQSIFFYAEQLGGGQFRFYEYSPTMGRHTSSSFILNQQDVDGRYAIYNGSRAAQSTRREFLTAAVITALTANELLAQQQGARRVNSGTEDLHLGGHTLAQRGSAVSAADAVKANAAFLEPTFETFQALKGRPVLIRVIRRINDNFEPVAGYVTAVNQNSVTIQWADDKLQGPDKSRSEITIPIRDIWHNVANFSGILEVFQNAARNRQGVSVNLTAYDREKGSADQAIKARSVQNYTGAVYAIGTSPTTSRVSLLSGDQRVDFSFGEIAPARYLPRWGASEPQQPFFLPTKRDFLELSRVPYEVVHIYHADDNGHVGETVGSIVRVTDDSVTIKRTSSEPDVTIPFNRIWFKVISGVGFANFFEPGKRDTSGKPTGDVVVTLMDLTDGNGIGALNSPKPPLILEVVGKPTNSSTGVAGVGGIVTRGNSRQRLHAAFGIGEVLPPKTSYFPKEGKLEDKPQPRADEQAERNAKIFEQLNEAGKNVVIRTRDGRSFTGQQIQSFLGPNVRNSISDSVKLKDFTVIPFSQIVEIDGQPAGSRAANSYVYDGSKRQLEIRIVSSGEGYFLSVFDAQEDGKADILNALIGKPQGSTPDSAAKEIASALTLRFSGKPVDERQITSVLKEIGYVSTLEYDRTFLAENDDVNLQILLLKLHQIHGGSIFEKRIAIGSKAYHVVAGSSGQTINLQNLDNEERYFADDVSVNIANLQKLLKSAEREGEETKRLTLQDYLTAREVARMSDNAVLAEIPALKEKVSYVVPLSMLNAISANPQLVQASLDLIAKDISDIQGKGATVYLSKQNAFPAVSGAIEGLLAKYPFIKTVDTQSDVRALDGVVLHGVDLNQQKPIQGQDNIININFDGDIEVIGVDVPAISVFRNFVRAYALASAKQDGGKVSQKAAINNSVLDKAMGLFLVDLSDEAVDKIKTDRSLLDKMAQGTLDSETARIIRYMPMLGRFNINLLLQGARMVARQTAMAA